MAADSERGVREPFRPLTGREREILDLLLSIDVPGIAELRSQALYASACEMGLWMCVLRRAG